MAIFWRKPSFWGPPAVRFRARFLRPLLLHPRRKPKFSPLKTHNSTVAMVKMSPRECRVIPLKGSMVIRIRVPSWFFMMCKNPSKRVDELSVCLVGIRILTGFISHSRLSPINGETTGLWASPKFHRVLQFAVWKQSWFHPNKSQEKWRWHIRKTKCMPPSSIWKPS